MCDLLLPTQVNVQYNMSKVSNNGKGLFVVMIGLFVAIGAVVLSGSSSSPAQSSNCKWDKLLNIIMTNSAVLYHSLYDTSEIMIIIMIQTILSDLGTHF